MEDPFYSANPEIGSSNGTYDISDAFPQGSNVGLQSKQSLIFQITCTQDSGAFDISASSPILYITAFDDPTFNGGSDVILDGSGVLTDSGSGTTDRVTFTVAKDLIPELLGQYPKSRRGNARIYTILEDGDSYVQLSAGVNIIDTSFNQSGGSQAVPVVGTGIMDTGRVEGTLTAPPANVVNENWLVGVGATGDWAGQDNNIATGTGSDWIFTSPIQGNFIYDFTEEMQKRYDGSLWITEIQVTTAADVPNVPSGNLTATDVQGALNELQTDIDNFTVADDSITNAKLANVSTLTIKGRLTGGTGDPEDLNATQAKQVLLLQNVDNTSDANKPVSTAQQTALDLKVDESTVTDAKFNADKLLGNPLDAATMTSPSNGQVPTYNSGTGEWEAGTPAGGGTAGGIEFQLNFETDITSSEPALGGIKFNSGTPASVTVIRCSATDANGVNINDRLSTLGSGDSFFLRVLSDVTKFLKVTVTTSSFVTTSYDISCTVVSPNGAGVIPAGSDVIGIDPEIITVGGATGVSSVFGRSLAVVAASGDYPSNFITDASTVGGPTVLDSLNSLNLDKMAKSDYDAANIDEQLVGITASQALTNKTVNGVILDSAGAGNLFLKDDGSYGTPAGGGDMLAATYDPINVNEQLAGLTATQSLTNKTVNGVNLTTAGSSTAFLNATGSYTVPAGGGGGITQTEAAAGTDNNQTGTAYTLVLADQENKTVWMNNAAANTVTIPTNASVTYPIGTKINVMMEGAGVTTIEGDTGVTVNGTSGGSVVINNQYQGATLSKRATNTWIVTGDIT